jgi:pentatricopeptide repeat protein
VESEKSRRRYRKAALETGARADVTTLGATGADKETEKKEGDDSIFSKVKGSALGEQLGMFLPPPTRRTVHCLLEILRDAAAAEEAMAVLTDMCDRARETEAAADKRPAFSALPEALPLTLTQSGRYLLGAQYAPSKSTFALVIEACVKAKNADLALKAFSQMERWGLYPDRRVYAALISAFGVRRDVASALGVFDEMRRSFTPDVATLQSILDVCMLDPLDLRQLCVVLEGLADDEMSNLEVYSKDILMVGFPDAVELGRALESMEMQVCPPAVSTQM